MNSAEKVVEQLGFNPSTIGGRAMARVVEAALEAARAEGRAEVREPEPVVTQGTQSTPPTGPVVCGETEGDRVCLQVSGHKGKHGFSRIRPAEGPMVLKKIVDGKDTGERIALPEITPA